MMPRYYGPGGGLAAISGLGQTTQGAAPTAPAAPPASSAATLARSDDGGTLRTVMMVASTAASAALAYHGYKRNNSVGWAVGWFFLGGLFWPIAVPVALAQGFAKPRVKSNRRRSSRRRSSR